jgi:hypothetical protein
VEQGGHHELIEANGWYAELFRNHRVGDGCNAELGWTALGSWMNAEVLARGMVKTMSAPVFCSIYELRVNEVPDDCAVGPAVKLHRR